MVWEARVSPETFCPEAATAVLLFVLNEVFDCLGIVWCLSKEEMKEGVVPPVAGAKAAGSTEAHNRLPWPPGSHLDRSEF